MSVTDLLTWQDASDYTRGLLVEQRTLEAALPGLAQAVTDATIARDTATTRLQQIGLDLLEVAARGKALA